MGQGWRRFKASDQSFTNDDSYDSVEWSFHSAQGVEEKQDGWSSGVVAIAIPSDEFGRACGRANA